MDSPRLQVIRLPISRADLAAIASLQFGDMVKAVIDLDRSVMAFGGELHSDEEAALLEDVRARTRGSTSTWTSTETGSSSSIR